jgi:hypothetical protein
MSVQYLTKEDLNMEVDEGQKMLHYARYCWPRRRKIAPSGKTWEQNFFESHGLSLDHFKSLMTET